MASTLLQLLKYVKVSVKWKVHNKDVIVAPWLANAISVQGKLKVLVVRYDLRKYLPIYKGQTILWKAYKKLHR